MLDLLSRYPNALWSRRFKPMLDPWWNAPPWALALRDEVRALRKDVKMADKTLDDILAEVANENTQVNGLSVLTAGIKAKLDAVLSGSLTPEQQAKVNAIFDGVQANVQVAVDAINANTDAAVTASGTTTTEPSPTV